MKITTNSIDYENLNGFTELLRNLTKCEHESPKTIEDTIFNRPKFRRTFGPMLSTLFLEVAKAINVTDLFEIGVMNGRHTIKILNKHFWNVHSFEPNIYCYPALVPLLENQRLNLVPFAVSDDSGFSEFNLPTRLLGKELNPMSGVSSLNKLLDTDAASSYIKSHTVATITGMDYIKLKNLNPQHIGLWIDTEGSGASVLAGFGSYLNDIPVIIIEVEYAKHFTSSPNWNTVYEFLNQGNFSIIGRDWQTEGQCNLLCLNKSITDKVNIMNLFSEYKKLISQTKNLI